MGPANDGEPRVWLSAAIGYVSLACWMVVMFPQIHTNYRRKSGEGASLAMMLAWVAGDVFNIAGALMQDLVATTVLIAAYYLFVDSTLLAQTVYYRAVYAAHRAAKRVDPPPPPPLPSPPGPLPPPRADPADPLLPAAHADATPPRVSRATRGRLQTALALALSAASIALLLVMLAALALGPGPAPVPPPPPSQQLLAQALGTASAVVYIMSYVPQAVKNYRRGTCEGLSIWLFLLSLLGNTTYALAIMVVSLDPRYLAPYVPWLLGALVPCLIHIVILYQFFTYPR